MSPRTRKSDLADSALRLLEELAKRGLTLTTAESCTAGCLATLLADAPGAAKHFQGGFVVYTKQQKTAVLGVCAQLLAHDTAVSRDVARAMAAGALALSPADVSVAITGVAGPEPDEDGNEVGLMHVAVASRNNGTSHKRFRFGEDARTALRTRVMMAALAMVSQLISSRRSPHRRRVKRGGSTR